jgi:copper(I)-binding protein
MNKKTLRRALGAGAVLLALVLTSGCGTSTSSGAATTPKSTTSGGLAVTDAWVKASDTEMTGAFGMIRNDSPTDITVVSGSSPVAGMVELHEVVMVDGAARMQPKQGGFVVKAGSTHELKPGSDHVMLMKLTEPLKSGTTVEVTLTTSTGTTVKFSAPVKVFSAGNETYKPSTPTMSGM